MPMATYMAIGLLGLGICRGMGSPGEQDSSRKRPNIIVIMADDMGYSDIGCYGSEISTPNLDRLASRGLRFTQFYNMARCCPTRASLLTGLHPHQTGIGHMTEDLGHPSYQGDLNRQCVTIAEALRPAGYRTLVAGKWHVTPGYKIESRHNWPLQRGFDRYYGEMIGAGSYYDPPILVRDNTVVKTREKDYFYTDAITSASLNYIEEFGNKQEPFFLYTAYTAPHWPLHAHPEDIEKYYPVYRDGWDALRSERLSRMIKMGLVEARWSPSPRDDRVPAWQDAPDKQWQIERMAVYAAMIEHMDRGIGKIMAKVKELGQERNTLVLFLADNGGCAEVLRPNMRDYLPDHAKILIPEFSPGGRPVREGNHPSILPGPADTYASYGASNAATPPASRLRMSR